MSKEESGHVFMREGDASPEATDITRVSEAYLNRLLALYNEVVYEARNGEFLATRLLIRVGYEPPDLTDEAAERIWNEAVPVLTSERFKRRMAALFEKGT